MGENSALVPLLGTKCEGIIQSWLANRNFGFILTHFGTIFLHRSEWNESTSDPCQSDLVEFILGKDCRKNALVALSCKSMNYSNSDSAINNSGKIPSKKSLSKTPQPQNTSCSSSPQNISGLSENNSPGDIPTIPNVNYSNFRGETAICSSEFLEPFDCNVYHKTCVSNYQNFTSLMFMVENNKEIQTNEHKFDSLDSIVDVYSQSINTFIQHQKQFLCTDLMTNTRKDEGLHSSIIIDNYNNAYHYLIESDNHPNLSIDIILHTHKLLTHNLLPECQSGKFRENKEAHCGKIYFVHSQNVPNAMMSLITIINTQLLPRKDIQPHTKAAWSLYQLCTIHPFHDSNGRLSRLVANWVLKRSGIPFAVMLCNTPELRKEYIQALRSDSEFEQSIGMTNSNNSSGNGDGNGSNNMHINTGINVASHNTSHATTSGTVDSSNNNNHMILPPTKFIEFFTKRLASTWHEFQRLYNTNLKEIVIDKRNQEIKLEQALISTRQELRDLTPCMICFEARCTINMLCCGKPVHLNCMNRWLVTCIKQFFPKQCPNCRSEIQGSSEHVGVGIGGVGGLGEGDILSDLIYNNNNNNNNSNDSSYYQHQEERQYGHRSPTQSLLAHAVAEQAENLVNNLREHNRFYLSRRYDNAAVVVNDDEDEEDVDDDDFDTRSVSISMSISSSDYYHHDNSHIGARSHYNVMENLHGSEGVGWRVGGVPSAATSLLRPPTPPPARRNLRVDSINNNSTRNNLSGDRDDVYEDHNDDEDEEWEYDDTETETETDASTVHHSYHYSYSHHDSDNNNQSHADQLHLEDVEDRVEDGEDGGGGDDDDGYDGETVSSSILHCRICNNLAARDCENVCCRRCCLDMIYDGDGYTCVRHLDSDP